MNRLRWIASYLFYRIEAARYGFESPGHYARYSADLATRRRLKS